MRGREEILEYIESYLIAKYCKSGKAEPLCNFTVRAAGENAISYLVL